MAINGDVLSYLHELRDAAEEYIGSKKFNAVQFFYRNKPEGYFENVKQHNHTMAKLKKDKNGDKRSPINNKLSGIFLGVSLSRGTLPTASPFGNTRIQFPIEAVFNETTRLYFTDFYCSTSSQHYVTLVLTKRGSSEDNFCQENLIELDLDNNSFLRMRNTACYGPSMFTTINKPGLIVEVFYTEKINIARLIRTYGSDRVFYSRTDIIGKGTSTWGGLKKNASCIHCNPSLRNSQNVETFYQRVAPSRSESYSDYNQPVASSRPSRPASVPRDREPDNPWSPRSGSYSDYNQPAASYRPSRPASVPRDREPDNPWSKWLLLGAGAIALFGLIASKFE